MYPCENIVEYANLNNKLEMSLAAKYMFRTTTKKQWQKYFKKAELKVE